MKIRIISAISCIFLMASCVEEAYVDTYYPTSGNEVMFSAELGMPQTRTIYGEDSDDATSIKISWSDADLISVYGTTCAVKQAEYAVKPATNDNGDSYAESLTKTGAAGVQWGSTVSDFFAIYPSVGSSDITVANGVASFKTSIDAQQYNVFAKTGKTWQGVPFDAANNISSMTNNIMYAYTPGVAPTDENGNPTTVNLRFKPFTTVLKFKVPTWTPSTISPNFETEPTGKSIQVTKITLTAPDGVAVAGDFTLHVSKDSEGNDVVTASAANNSTNTNTIVIEPQSPITWLYGEELEFSMFTIPLSGLTVGGWSVTIHTSDAYDVIIDSERHQSNGDKTFKLAPSSTSATDSNGNTYNPAALAAGKIHKVNIAKGFGVYDIWTYNQATWMKSIPRNVYIADLSLPGSWYACDSGYQDGSLADQYAAGIRSFNIDCRLTLKVGENVANYDNNGTAILGDMVYVDNTAHAKDGTLVLACSGTETNSFTVSWSGRVYYISSIDKTVKQALIEIGKLTKDNPEEYTEVIITVAQKPKSNDALLADNCVYGTVNAEMMYTAITNVLNDAEVIPYLYTDRITPNTTLGDVKGKVVVKVNMNTENSNLSTWNIAAPALFSEGTMAESADAGRYIKQANFTTMNSPAMFWSNSFNPTAGNAMIFHYHQAQNTTGTSPFPTVANRKAAIESILSQSYAEYSSNGHNGWYQLGIGGWTDDSDEGKEALSKELKPYVYGIINSMLTGTAYNGKTYKPAPVGAVLMNHSTATTNNTADLIKAIIDLNGAYFLNRDENQEAWPTAPQAQSAAASYSSGMNDQNVSAFSWE
ncbi:MAG: hypothetical protein E7117_08625 [Bacteroidales bacterium]|nr:hypothetical protein [Bacteroidales bacterium]